MNPEVVNPAAIFYAMQYGVPEPVAEIADVATEVAVLAEDLEIQQEVLVILPDDPDGGAAETHRDGPTEDVPTGPGDTEVEEPPNKKTKTSEPGQIPVWQPCKSSCKRGCVEKIDSNQRTKIWQDYQTLTYNQKRQMIFRHVSRIPTQRHSKGEHESRRDNTFLYKLTNANGIEQQVCKSFFLNTLGYNIKNDRLISTVMKTTAPADLTSTPDMRGRQPCAKKINMDPIKEHISSFKPSTSHYRREHAPYRKYLPSDITSAFMHSDFREKHPDVKCGLETYRKCIRDMNISFTKLGEEECEICKRHNLHVNPSGTAEKDAVVHINCPECENWTKHKTRADVGREKYQEDSNRDWPVDCVAKSADLQKVIMLPRMPGNKTAIFTRRIIAFHETFATLGKKRKGKAKEKTISIVWHEGIAGRKAEEVTSAFLTALEKVRDKKHVILWLDNCSAQNKNWCIITQLVALVNSHRVSFEDVTLNFFEPGHTFMSADSFHHGVELEMKQWKGVDDAEMKCRKGGDVYDFQEFVEVIESSNSRSADVIVLENEKVRAYKGGQSQAKLKRAQFLLASISVLQFRRGSRSLFYKKEHNDEHFTELDFLKNRFDLEVPQKLRENGRGIPVAKKADIMSKLCPMMPASRRLFWESLIEDNNAELDVLD